MGTAFDTITDPMRDFVSRQHMFFVATAPNDGGRVNVSPKGYDSFHILGPNQVCYLDLTGSGAETIAHVRENGRITFMFCAFEGKPNIVRFYGSARVVLHGTSEFAELIVHFGERPGARSIIVADIDRTSNSCGYSVPFMDFVEERDRLNEYWKPKSADDMTAYWAKKNTTSIDGLPAIGADG